jgi:hypothetical protein
MFFLVAVGFTGNLREFHPRDCLRPEALQREKLT